MQTVLFELGLVLFLGTPKPSADAQPIVTHTKGC